MYLVSDRFLTPPIQECLAEQIQILHGKISVLEDELAKLSQQHQEKGEVLGPIVEVGGNLSIYSHAYSFMCKAWYHVEFDT